jgi:hypothetical protein
MSMANQKSAVMANQKFAEGGAKVDPSSASPRVNVMQGTLATTHGTGVRFGT